MPSRTDRVALITGAGRGIGRAVALRLARADIACAVVARSTGEIDEVAETIRSSGRTAAAFVLDVADERACADVVTRVEREIGPIDTLINNAGIAKSASLEKTSDELWDLTYRINVRAPYVLTRLVLPGMTQRGFGRIVNVASTAARKGYRYTSAYTASKHALLGMTRAFSDTVVAAGVTVNAVCPGYVDTPMTRATIANIREKTGLTEADALAALTTESPLGRLVEPDEVAETIAWLVGRKTGATSGQAIGVAGGEVG